MTNFADDNTPYDFGTNTDEVIDKLEKQSELFRVKESKYSFRNKTSLVSNIPHTTKYGLNTFTHLAPKFWEKISNDVKDSNSLSIFNAQIKH